MPTAESTLTLPADVQVIMGHYALNFRAEVARKEPANPFAEETWEASLQEDYAAIKAAAEAWRAKWPAHCTRCRGWGGFGFTEMHGFTHGAGEQMFDLCDALPDVHTCHRCGAAGLNEEGEGPCTACGWNCDDGVPEL